METPKFHALLAALEQILRNEPAVLIGSAPLAVLGLRDVNDLDVLVKPNTVEILAARGATEYDSYSAAFVLPVGTIQITSQLYNLAANCGLTEAQVWQRADMWQSWQVWNIQHCKTFKATVRREKDVDDLLLIERHLGRTKT